MRLWLSLSIALLAATGCHRSEELKTHGEQKEPAAQTPPAVQRAIARIMPTEGNEAHGTVRFEQLKNGVRVHVDLTGLTPNAKHGFHIHQYGDCTSKTAESAGDHYSPSHARHGMPGVGERHAGDMGNLIANAKGEAHFEQVFDVMTVDGTDNPILGRAVIIHEKSDKGTQPSGDAGKRIGCGVIGTASGGSAS
ncbi:MAG TPA: superoxide dismutase family protein [Polyangiaceae bacterium]|jgi:Cu-Zn family superoxide dismutase|nr:superoxide dismutase family protein [Polyangiaceae bacterium]